MRLSENAVCDVITAYTAGDAGSGKSADGRQPMKKTIFVHFVHFTTILFSYLSLFHTRFLSLVFCHAHSRSASCPELVAGSRIPRGKHFWILGHAHSGWQTPRAKWKARYTRAAKWISPTRGPWNSLRNLYTRIIFVIEREIAFPPLKSGSLSLSGVLQFFWFTMCKRTISESCRRCAKFNSTSEVEFL